MYAPRVQLCVFARAQRPYLHEKHPEAETFALACAVYVLLVACPAVLSRTDQGANMKKLALHSFIDYLLT